MLAVLFPLGWFPPSILPRSVRIDMIIGCGCVCKIYSGVLSDNTDNTRILNLSFNPPLAIGQDLPQWEVRVRSRELGIGGAGRGGGSFRIPLEHEAPIEDGGWSQVRPAAWSTHDPCWGHERIASALSFSFYLSF